MAQKRTVSKNHKTPEDEPAAAKAAAPRGKGEAYDLTTASPDSINQKMGVVEGVANRYDDAFRIVGKDGKEVTNSYRSDTVHDPTRAQRNLMNQMSGEFMEDRDQAGYVPERIDASTADLTTAGDVERFNVADPGAEANKYEAALAAAPERVNIGSLTPTRDVEASSASGPGAASMAGMERVTGADLDTADADKVRSRQDNYLNSLEARARGDAPSKAEAAYGNKLADIQATALGQAATARGSDRAYARLKAIETNADQSRKAAMDTASLRAGEMDSASQALGAGLGSVRGQDVDIAKTAAQLRQEANLSNQRTTTGTEQFNAAAANQRMMENAQVGERNADRAQAASAANAGATNDRTMAEAGLRVGADTGNAARAQQGAQFNATATGAARADAAAAQNARDVMRAQQQTAANAANTGAANARGDVTAAAANQNAQFNAGQTQTAAGTNQAAGLAASAQDTARKAGLAQAALGAQQQATSVLTAQAGKPRDKSMVENLAPSIIQGTAEGLAASDERLKEGIKDVPDRAAERLANALQTKEFEYKDGTDYDDGRQHFGVMAQDLEKDPLGRKLVGRDDDGNKTVDYQGLTQLLLAAALRGKKEARR
jgi:hypothetical protein